MNYKRVNFDELVESLESKLIEGGDLSVWGGTCTEGDLEAFLAGWPLERIPYRIWESADRIDFVKNEPAPTVALLERCRLFGAGGDLDLRRDGDTFRWRFVGAPDVRPPEVYALPENNYWTHHPDAAFHRYEKTGLLWGKRNGARWHEDRVAAAELDYPASDGADRVQIQYTLYSRAGRVEFVWLTEVNEWKEEDNG